MLTVFQLQQISTLKYFNHPKSTKMQTELLQVQKQPENKQETRKVLKTWKYTT